MVMNEKILQRKFEKIVKIFNEDGGCTLIEVMGLLRYTELRYVDEMHQRALQKLDDDSMSYEALKRSRLGDLS